jgi:O-antigen/teichoic acid export membrane protein
VLNKLRPKSEFSRNVLTLMTGTTIAQAIPIAISPILTRIYTPEDFGVFALYMSIASMVAVFATGRYEMAIMLPKKDSDAINIVALSILISFFVSFVTFLIVSLLNQPITMVLNNPEISTWLYFIPLTVLLTGFYQSFNYWSNRNKEYRRLATNKVIYSGVTATTNMSLGVSGWGSSGLIIGQLFGHSVATLLFAKRVWKDIGYRTYEIKKLKIFALMKKYINFPKINLLHAFLNLFSSNLPILLISYFFNNTLLGFYALSNRVLVSPMAIVTNAYGQVFMQKMTEVYHKKSNELLFFKNHVMKILLYSFFPFALFFIYAPSLFVFIFGEAWEEAGLYAQILIPMLYLRFTGSIVSSITIIYHQQGKALVIEIVNTLLRVVALIIGGVWESIIMGLILFSFFSASITLYRLMWYINIIKKGHHGI